MSKSETTTPESGKKLPESVMAKGGLKNPPFSKTLPPAWQIIETEGLSGGSKKKPRKKRKEKLQIQIAPTCL